MNAILYALLAAVFYAINIPASKVLLRDVGPTTMAALLYLGAGIGIAILSLLNTQDRKASAPLIGNFEIVATTHLHTFPRRLRPHAYDHAYPRARPFRSGRHTLPQASCH